MAGRLSNGPSSARCFWGRRYFHSPRCAENPSLLTGDATRMVRNTLTVNISKPAKVFSNRIPISSLLGVCCAKRLGERGAQAGLQFDFDLLVSGSCVGA